jgi:hypothetical protein
MTLPPPLALRGPFQVAGFWIHPCPREPLTFVLWAPSSSKDGFIRSIAWAAIRNGVRSAAWIYYSCNISTHPVCR